MEILGTDRVRFTVKKDKVQAEVRRPNGWLKKKVTGKSTEVHYWTIPTKSVRSHWTNCLTGKPATAANHKLLERKYSDHLSKTRDTGKSWDKQWCR